MKPGPMHWELGVLATGPPGELHQRWFLSFWGVNECQVTLCKMLILSRAGRTTGVLWHGVLPKSSSGCHPDTSSSSDPLENVGQMILKSADTKESCCPKTEGRGGGPSP